MTDEHQRGCPGREVTCTCGFDDGKDALIRELVAERNTFSQATVSAQLNVAIWKDRAEKAEALIRYLVTAGKRFTVFDMEDWPDTMRLFEDDPTLTMGDIRQLQSALAKAKAAGFTP